jgi:hypothetical protein
MKRVSLLFVLVLALFAGCKKEVEEVEKILSFDITNTKTFTAPMNEVNLAFALQQQDSTFTMPLPVKGISSSSEADFQKNGTSTNLVKNIVPKELILTLPDNSPESFAFLKRMDIEITMADGSEPLLMAYNRNIPANVGKRLVFTPTQNTMDKYVKAGEYGLRLTNVRLRQPVTADLNITANLTFSVTASPL